MKGYMSASGLKSFEDCPVFTGVDLLTLNMVSEEELSELYWDEGLTQTEIADCLGLSDAAISRWMDEHDVASREERHQRGVRATRADRAKFETEPSGGYEVWRDSNPGVESAGVTLFHHTLLAIVHGANPHELFGRQSPKVVHHKNGIPWDNRVENLQVVDREEHNKAHHPINVGEI